MKQKGLFLALLCASLMCVSMKALSLESVLKDNNGGFEALLHSVGVTFEDSMQKIMAEKPSFTSFVQMMKTLGENPKKSTVRAIQKMLKKLEGEVNRDQANHDTLATNVTNECTEEISYRQEQIAVASTTLAKAEESQSKCEASLSRNKNNVLINQQVQRSKQDELDSLRTIRSEQHKTYLAQVKDHQEAIRIIAGAIPMVEQLVSPIYLQIKTPEALAESLKEFKANTMSLIMKSFKFHKSPALSSVIAGLVQVTADANIKPSDVARMIDLLNQLRSKLQEDLAAIEREEDNQLTAFQTQEESLKNLLDVMKGQEHQINDLISELEACIADETAISAAASSKKRRNERMLNKTETFCNSFNDEVKLASTARKESLELYTQMKSWLTDYLKAEEAKKNAPAPAAGTAAGAGAAAGASAAGAAGTNSTAPAAGANSTAAAGNTTVPTGGAAKAFFVEVTSDAVEEALNEAWLADD